MSATRRHSFSLLRKVFRSDRGNLTPLVALSAVPLAVVAGGAIDYVNMNRDITEFQAAADAAAFAVTSSTRSALSGLSESQKAQRLTELKAYAQDYIDRNYKPNFALSAADTLNLNITGQKVTLTAEHTVPLTWMKAFGIAEPRVEVTSEVLKAARPVELVMVMDTTGSMGTTYMNQAKTAARNLLTKIYSGDATSQPENQYIRVALVPFSGAIRLNMTAYDYSQNWIDTTGAAAVSKLNFNSTSWHNYMAWTNLSNRPWNGCVEARGGAYKTDDTAPTDGNTLFTPYFAPDEPTFTNSSSYGFYNSYISNSGTPNEQTSISSTSTSSSNWLNRQQNQNKYVNKTITAESSSQYGPWFNCAKSTIVPMTYDRSKIEAGITAMTASGSTVIPEGLAWGWRVLSPTEPLTKVEAGPTLAASTLAPYNDAQWQKIMVLMTDGENDVLSGGNEVNSLNGSWYSSYGRSKATSNNRFGTTTTSQANAALDTAMLSICTKIKNEGITLYTVAFRVNSTTIQNNLKNCATSLTHYSYAADGVALAAVFDHIGENVANTTIRLNK
ncbi:MAG: VWA domain-containing protein [Alphaproteobacteria bacterium]|nr:VWA domain-containing protein [Alphaproteobacteria bacterium]